MQELELTIAKIRDYVKVAMKEENKSETDAITDALEMMVQFRREHVSEQCAYQEQEVE